MNPSRPRLDRESDVACENQDNAVYQFCQDQDEDPESTKEKLREYNGAKVGGSLSLLQLRVSRVWAHNCCAISSSSYIQQVRFASVFCFSLLTLLLLLRVLEPNPQVWLVASYTDVPSYSYTVCPLVSPSSSSSS